MVQKRDGTNPLQKKVAAKKEQKVARVTTPKNDNIVNATSILCLYNRGRLKGGATRRRPNSRVGVEDKVKTVYPETVTN